MVARFLAFVIWAAVAAAATFWVLRMAVSAPGAPSHAVSVSDAVAVRGDLTRLLGAAAPAEVVAAAATPIAPEMASRFRLLGVVAPKSPRRVEGLALIAIDGKPARAFKVGAAVEGELVLQMVHARGAALGARGGPADLTLELPPLPAAATGRLPNDGSFGINPQSAMPAGNDPPMAPSIPQRPMRPVEPMDQGAPEGEGTVDNDGGTT